MVAVPSAEEEDAERPSRERESLVGERTRIVNRMKGPWPGSASAASSLSCGGRGIALSFAYT